MFDLLRAGPGPLALSITNLAPYVAALPPELQPGTACFFLGIVASFVVSL